MVSGITKYIIPVLSDVTINKIRRPPIVVCKICQQISMCERRFN